MYWPLPVRISDLYGLYIYTGACVSALSRKDRAGHLSTDASTMSIIASSIFLLVVLCIKQDIFSDRKCMEYFITKARLSVWNKLELLFPLKWYSDVMEVSPSLYIHLHLNLGCRYILEMLCTLCILSLAHFHDKIFLSSPIYCDCF
jgi:hypothetical protein